MKKHLKCNKM